MSRQRCQIALSARGQASQASFTLLETMMAMTMMVSVIMHVVGAQGNMLYNTDYSRRMTEAMWLAKAIMSKVEYHWDYKDLKSLEQGGKVKRAAFKELDLPEEQQDYRYSLRIEEWKFPLLKLLEGGAVGSDGSAAEGAGFPIKDILKSVLGEHILKVAYVEVFWPEGARENSVELVYLLTNQRGVDTQLTTLKSTYEDLVRKVASEGMDTKKPKSDRGCKQADPQKPFYDRVKKECVAVRPRSIN